MQQTRAAGFVKMAVLRILNIGALSGSNVFHLIIASRVSVSDILVTQKGLRFLPGRNVAVARNDTLYSKINGIVRIEKDPFTRRTSFNVDEEFPADCRSLNIPRLRVIQFK